MTHYQVETFFVVRDSNEFLGVFKQLCPDTNDNDVGVSN